jgi:hypothetical protein
MAAIPFAVIADRAGLFISIQEALVKSEIPAAQGGALSNSDAVTI